MRRPFTVRLFGGCSTRSRYSIGSRPSSVGDLVELALEREARLHVPWPRLGPHGGLFVNTRAPSNLYAGIRYGTVSSAPE